jgi:hypothetical protein
VDAWIFASLFCGDLKDLLVSTKVALLAPDITLIFAVSIGGNQRWAFVL